ncbi:hypothetical protein LCGC14_0273330 [marine sediment metagenome]|uniref:Uncharacterized protein n=2 Tax=root TaxID=1 RepID=A0A9C9TI68_9HYPH|nr:hypothetical protein [Aurantimonas coralicida]
MGAKTYNRDKDPDTNATPIDITYDGAETPTAEAPLAVGTTGEAAITVLADADESGGIDVQPLYTVSLVPVIDAAAPGGQRLTVTVTPILGGGGSGTPLVFTAPHPETMDAWQTAAGRPQQV